MEREPLVRGGQGRSDEEAEALAGPCGCVLVAIVGLVIIYAVVKCLAA